MATRESVGDTQDPVEGTDDSVSCCCPWRWVVCGMGVWMAMTSYMMCTNMSVAIVCMAKQPTNVVTNYNSSLKSADVNNNDLIVKNKSLRQLGEKHLNPGDKTNLFSDQVSSNTNNSTYDGLPSRSEGVESINKQKLVTSTKSGVEATLPRDVNGVEYKNGVLPASSGDIRRDDDVYLNLPNIDSQCDVTTRTDSSYEETVEFTWDKITQSYVLSGFYYGYTVGQIPFGWLAGRYGGRHVVGTCMLIVSAITMMIPILAKTDVYLVVVARVFIGLLSGAFSPGWYMLIGVWSLPNERSRFSAAMWLGQVLGIIMGYTTSGLLCVHGFGNKWASIFYAQGLLGIVFVVCWWLLVYNSPRQHPRISNAEVTLIEQHVKRKGKIRVPWCKIMSYVPCWAMFITHFCDNCIYYLCITCLPLYMKEILKFDIQSNGFFSSLPFIVMMTGTIVAGCMADCIRSKQWMKITNIRKMFQIIGLLGVAVFILIPGYLTCDLRAVVIVCLCLCTFCESVGNVGGYTCVAVDIAPRFASVIFAISNSIASLPGIMAPLAVAELTKNETSEEWRVVFCVAASVAVFAALVFCLFSSSERAPWADDDNICDETDKIKPLIFENGLKTEILVHGTARL